MEVEGLGLDLLNMVGMSCCLELDLERSVDLDWTAEGGLTGGEGDGIVVFAEGEGFEGLREERESEEVPPSKSDKSESVDFIPLFEARSLSLEEA